MGVNKTLLAAILAGMGGGGLSVTKEYDFTTGSLPSGLSFSRAGTRTAIVSGALTTLSSGTPAFESWGGESRGLSIEGSATNLLTYSNDFSNAAYSRSNMGTPTAGANGPDGVANSGWLHYETAVSGYHWIKRTVASISAGSTRTMSCFVKLDGASTRAAVALRMANEWDNEGALASFMVNGVNGHWSFDGTTAGKEVTGTKAGVRALANGWYQLWFTGTFGVTGNKEFTVSPLDYLNGTTNERSYLGVVTEGVNCYGMQVTAGAAPFSYIPTVASTVANTAESLTVSDLSWFTSAQGTFVVEHDADSGAIIGSGATAIITATVPGKTAFAWDGTGSDLVNNGGAASGGATPSFTDLRILGTSAGSNNARVKSIKFYNTRLSVAQMQALTSPTIVSTAVPGSLRTVTLQNRMPNNAQSLSGTVLNFFSRYKMTIGANDVASIKLDFANFTMPGTAIGNSVNISEVAFERETGVVEYAPVTFSASRSMTMTSGVKHKLSDTLLPSAFTGLSVFPANSVWWVRLKGSVAAPGNYAGSQWPAASGAQAWRYDPAATTVSAVDATGVFTSSGTSLTAVTYGLCPLVVGVHASDDPKTAFIIGDSLCEGTGGLATTGTFIQNALASLGVPNLMYARGGSSQLAVKTSAVDWRSYLAYARMMIDGMGSNDSNRMLIFFDYWHTARTTYGYGKVVHVGLLPNTSSTDSWATEANQTIIRAYPGTIERFKASAKTYGYIDSDIVPQSVRGVDLSKWKAPGPYTTDGGHPNQLADNAIRDELAPLLDAITLP